MGAEYVPPAAPPGRPPDPQQSALTGARSRTGARMGKQGASGLDTLRVLGEGAGEPLRRRGRPPGTGRRRRQSHRATTRPNRMPTRPPKRALQTAGGPICPRATRAPVVAARSALLLRAGRRRPTNRVRTAPGAGRETPRVILPTCVSSAARGSLRRSRARQPGSGGHVRQHRGATRAHERRRPSRPCKWRQADRPPDATMPRHPLWAPTLPGARERSSASTAAPRPRRGTARSDCSPGRAHRSRLGNRHWLATRPPSTRCGRRRLRESIRQA